MKGLVQSSHTPLGMHSTGGMERGRVQEFLVEQDGRVLTLLRMEEQEVKSFGIT